MANPAATPSPLAPIKDWEKFDAYHNIGEGGGKVRGIYTQRNYAISPIFAQWIAPLKDLGVTTVTTESTLAPTTRPSKSPV
ncbi:MAG: hypothetical protein ACRYGF_04270 [Janthinobacterium lividum]